jgi:3-dehydroquinate synthase
VTVTVRVDVAATPYDVVIGGGLIDGAVAFIAPFLRRPLVAVVMDETVSGLHGARLIGGLEAAGVAARSVVIAPGEAAKSFEGLSGLADRFSDLGLERTDLIIAFGGGVVGDLAGLAAALYQRGVDYVQMPTTLLAQVDSAVGGKTAIDTARGKNLIGAFHHPRLVLADLAVLDTLPTRELVCGCAEVLKCALMADGAFFDWLEIQGREVLARAPEALAHAVRRAVEIKAAIVTLDEREGEGGARALLNLGHTFAHALEAETGFGETLKHGEAVGLGCVMAFRFSAALGLCPPPDAERARKAAAAAGLPTRLADIAGGPFSAASLLTRVARDKKMQGGALTFILVRGIGEAFVARGVGRDDLRAFLLSEGATP